MDRSFEAALTKRLRAELDALDVAAPAAKPQFRRSAPMRYVWTVGRPLALTLAVALLLGSVAALASGSPDPSQWVIDAKRSLGLPPTDDETPFGLQASPSPHPSESPEPRESPESSEPAEPAEHRSPEPSSTDDHHSPEPAEHSSEQPSGDS